MPYFLCSTNQSVHFLSEQDIENGGESLLPEACEPISDEQAKQLQAPKIDLVPESVTRYQARAALYQAGLLDDVEAMMADPKVDRLVLIAWQDAQIFKRDSPVVIGLSARLGLTESQIDALFMAASAIE